MFPYMGGKSKQSKWIQEVFPKNFDNYVEVFGGAFWVYINSDNLHNKKTVVYKDHITLSEILKEIQGKFVLSYYRKPEIEKMYPESEFFYLEKDYKRSSTSVKKGGTKQNATELLILNYNSNQKTIF